MTIFIPDIHGREDLRAKLVIRLINEWGFQMGRNMLIYGGDMVDRGPNSAQVLDGIKWECETYPGRVIALKGNHEGMMIKALQPAGFSDRVEADWLWKVNGGGATLHSFPSGMVPKEMLDWLKSLPTKHEERGFFFSHAPAPREEHRPIYLKEQPFTEEELTWTYGEAEEVVARDHGVGADGVRVIGVCGHIHALHKGVMAPRFYDHYIFADAGCGCSDEAPLVAINVETRAVLYEWPAKTQGAGYAG